MGSRFYGLNYFGLWRSTLKTWGKVLFHDVFVIVSVTLIAVFLHNLALAVLTGVILSALVFA